MNNKVSITVIEGMNKFNRDLRIAAKQMTGSEARYIVDLYYAIQEQRMGIGSMISSIDRDTPEEPHTALDYMMHHAEQYEASIKSALTAYARTLPEWGWMEAVKGIGPVLTVGLNAYIDVDKAKAVSSIWRYGGYDPTSKWEKGQKRPWNAALKVLFWKIGESFIKVQSRPNAYYGALFRQYKEDYTDRNEAFGYAESAREILATKNFARDTTAKAMLESGKLPLAQIHARARRATVKVFLSHYFEVRYFCRHGVWPAKPWIIEHGGHVHYFDVPHWDLMNQIPMGGDSVLPHAKVRLAYNKPIIDDDED